MISVIIPTYNRAKLLNKCINSLINQNYPRNKYEVIVVDDGSKDNTELIIRNLMKKHKNIRYIKHDNNKGVAAARNTGIRSSRGKIISIVADDYILPKLYLLAVNKHFRDKGINIMSFDILVNDNNFLSNIFQFYYDTGRYSSIYGDKNNTFFMNLHKGMIIKDTLLPASGAAAFRKRLFEKIGFFDEALKTGEDTDLSYKLHKENVYVHYNSFIKIKHCYHDNIFKIMKRTFNYGKSYYKIKKKHPDSSLILPDTIKNLVKDIAEVIYRPFVRCRYAGSFGTFILYCPFMFLFDLSRVSGIFYGYIKK